MNSIHLKTRTVPSLYILESLSEFLQICFQEENYVKVIWGDILLELSV